MNWTSIIVLLPVTVLFIYLWKDTIIQMVMELLGKI